MVQERLNKIATMVQSNGMVNAGELAHDFGVSLETIRRDLELLEKKGQLKRVYGGAVASFSHGLEREYVSRTALNVDLKQAISKRAADFIKDGDTIALDLGTTAFQVAKQLVSKKSITCVTNSLPVGMELSKNSSCNVHILGGTLRNGDFSTSGFMAEWGIMNFRVDKAIISSSGVTLKSGVTDYNVAEAEVRRKMIEIANQTILVADSSKFTDDTFIKVCDLDKIDILVTDWNIPSGIEEMFRPLHTELVIAQPVNSEANISKEQPVTE